MPNSSAYRALVIDRDERVRRETGRALEARGIPALTAPCGLTGLDLLLERLFEICVVVSDLGASGLDGWSLVRVIRQLGNEQDLRLVIVGDRVSAPHAAHLAAMGADAVVDRADGPERIADRASALLAAGPRATKPSSLQASPGIRTNPR